MTLKNPFLNRVMIQDPEFFFGRSHEVTYIFNRLNADRPQSVAVVGMRRIGKSSLLYHCADSRIREKNLDHPENHVFSYMDLQTIRSADASEFYFKAGELLRTEKPDLDFPEIRNQSDFHDLVKKMDGMKIRWIILLDEFETLTCNPNFGPDFFSFLRSMANTYDLAYITATGQDLGELCHSRKISDSPFFNIFTSIRLGPFGEPTAIDLISRLSEREGLSMAPHARAIMNKTGRLPMFLQMGGAAFADFLIKNGTDARPDWIQIKDLFMDEARSHFNYLWDNLSEPEKTVLERLTSGEKVDDKSLAHVIRLLTRNGIIHDQNGNLVVSSEWFHDYLDEQPKNANEMAPKAKVMDEKKEAEKPKEAVSKRNSLISGFFYLFMIVVIMALVAAISKYVPWYALPIVVVAGLVSPMLIGVLQALNEGTLSEKGFIEVIRESYKLLLKTQKDASKGPMK